MFYLCKQYEGNIFFRWRGFYDCPAVVDSVEKITDVGAKDTEIETVQQSVGELYTITAYCPCEKCCGKTDGITASGVKAVQGVTVAADTRKLGFGTKIYIDGVGERIVQDTGSAIKGKKIDLYFENHQEAWNFGRQTRQVTILN